MTRVTRKPRGTPSTSWPTKRCSRFERVSGRCFQPRYPLAATDADGGVTERDLTGEFLPGIQTELPKASRDDPVWFEHVEQRLELTETALRASSERRLAPSRATRAATPVRADVERRLDEHEDRLAALEQRRGS